MCSILESNFTKTDLYDDFSKPEQYGYSIFVNIPKLKKPIPLFILFGHLV